MTSVEVKFFRRTTEYALVDQKKYEEILKEFQTEPADEKLRRCKLNCNNNEQQDTKTDAEL